MTTRRNPFSGLQPSQAPVHPSPPLYENLRVAERRTRNRRWEKEHLAQKAMYRGVDPQLALQVKKISSQLLVPTGEVARALLEYGLRAYAEGDLDLDPRPNPQGLRMTLYPTKETLTEKRQRGGMPPRKKKPEPETGWRVIVTWRGLPTELKQEIAVLSSEEGLNVPAGELVTALLRFSLKAYEYGLLKLDPVEKVAGYSLYEGAE